MGNLVADVVQSVKWLEEPDEGCRFRKAALACGHSAWTPIHLKRHQLPCPVCTAVRAVEQDAAVRAYERVIATEPPPYPEAPVKVWDRMLSAEEIKAESEKPCPL